MLLVAITYYSFAPAQSGPFIFDDFPNLENMRHLNEGVTPESLGRYLASPKGVPGRPLAMLSFLIEDSAWPAYPADYKRNNLLFHLVNGLLILWLTLRLTRYLPISTATRHWVPLLCTAAWLLNPIQLSATMLVVQRMTLLSTLFTLAGLIAYLACLESDRLKPLPRTVFAGLVLSAFTVLAFLCKENGVLVFAYATALNLTLLRPLIATFPTLPRRLLLLGTSMPLIALATLAALNWGAIEAPYKLREFTLFERAITQPRILFDYLGNIFIPRIGGQGILHDDYVFSRSLFEPASTWVAVAGLLIASTTAWLLRQRYPLFAFAVLWFLGGHLIESSIVGLELYFEHRNYLPMMGPLLAFTIVAINPARLSPTLTRSAFALWLAVCIGLLHVNAYTWGNRGQQALVWLQEHPQSQRATQWAAAYHLENGDTDQARRTLQQAIARIDQADDLRLQAILIDCFSRGVTPAQWQTATRLLSTTPFSNLPPSIIAELVKQLSGSACHDSLTEDRVLQLANALLNNPAYQADPGALSYVHYELAKIYARTGRLDLLMQHMDHAYRLNPQPSVAREQAIYLLSAGLPEQALEYLDKSNSTPMPWLKKLLIDVPKLNQPLQISAQAMLEQQTKHATLPDDTHNRQPDQP